MKTQKVLFLAGPSCSGKTFQARSYKKTWGDEAEVICMDNYFRDMGDQTLEEEYQKHEGRFGIYDMPTSYHLAELDLALEQLLKGQDIEVPIYDLDKNVRIANTNTIKAGKRLYVVEGLYALYLNQRKAENAESIFVDAPFEVRLQRRLTRDSGKYDGVTDEMIRWVFQEKAEAAYDKFGYLQRALAQSQIITG